MLKRLSWECDFFQTECAEVPEGLKATIPYHELQHFDWVQGKSRINDTASIRLLESMDFHFEDLRITFGKKPLKRHIMAISLSEATENDACGIEAIAKTVFVENSRFTSLFDQDKIANFYATWAFNAIQGIYDDLCLVLKFENAYAGFVTLKFLTDTQARIGLIGVNPEFRSKGIGTILIQSIENHALEHGCHKLLVITEGKNLSAQRFYIRNGYNIECIESWYYWKRC